MRRFLFLCFLALSMGLLPARFARAGKVKVWHHARPADHEKARLHQAVVSSEGVIRLARRLEPLANLDARHVWALAEDSQGNLYAATGDEGKLFRISPAGKTSVVYTASGSQILSLVVTPDDTVYAGVGPTGTIVQVPPSGEGKVRCKTGASYVWSLVWDEKEKALYAGTGPQGRIYHISQAGQVRLFHDSRQDHILCLARDAKGTLYAGTDRDGVVYRLDRTGKAFVLFQAPQSEVRTLVVKNHSLHVGTSATSEGRGGSGSGSSSSLALQAPDKRVKAVPVSRTHPSQARTAASDEKKDKSDSKDSPASGHKASARAAPESGENSIYRITSAGLVREIFRDKVLILDVLSRNHRLFVGTGMKGQLFEVNEETREYQELARLDHGQVLCLCQRRDGSIVVGTGDPGKVYVLRQQHQARGTVDSCVLDARFVSKWGAVNWQGEVPTGTSVQLAVRTGNVAEPDETWSRWHPVVVRDGEGTITAPPARYLQYRLTLASTEPSLSPAVRSVTIRYATTNQAPELIKLTVPDLDAANLKNAKKREFSWKAEDANEDELVYSVWIRQEGWDAWVRLAENLDDDEYTWDTTTAPSGVYRVKVVASDSPSNPEHQALAAERITAPFIVSHTPPAVSVKQVGVEGGRVILEGAASSLVRLTSASFALNGKKWKKVFPTDGLFDRKRESFHFRTEPLRPGRYVLVLQVQDAAGNTGSKDVLFTIAGPEKEK
jgi:outer membrane protein assembly factor BamB